MSAIITPKIGHFRWKLKHWKIFKFSPPQKKHPKMRFFRKMAPITTSGSGFHFIFEFLVLELIENDINIDRVCGRLFEIFRVKVWNMQKLCKWVTCIPKRNFLWQFVGIVVPYHGDKNWAISLKTLGLRKIEVFVGLSFLKAVSKYKRLVLARDLHTGE